MKSIFFVLLVGLPFLGFGQVVDSTAVMIEVDSLIKVARAFSAKREYDKALEVNAITEKIVLEKLGKASAAYGKYCYSQARIFDNKSEYLVAENFYKEALIILEKELGKKNPDYTWCLINLGCLYKDRGHHDRAEPLLLEATKIFEDLYGKKSREYASNLNNLADLYRKKGILEESERLFLESKDIIGNLLGKEHPHYLIILNNIAILHDDMGFLEKAERTYIEALNIRGETVGKESPEYAVSMNNLASFYARIGNFEKAEPLYLEAKRIREKVSGKDHPDYASTLNSMAVFYKNMGNYGKAESYFLESLAIRGKALGKEDTRYAKSLGNLANLYRIIGKYDKAEPLFLETKNIFEKALGKEHTEYAISLGNLANFYWTMGNYNKAEQLYIEALAIQEKMVGKNHPSYASVLSNLSILYRDLGEYEKAKILCLEEISITEKTFGKEHESYLNSLGNLALLYWQLGDFEKSEVGFTELSTLTQSSITKTFHYLSEQELSFYINRFSKEHDMLFSFLYKSISNRSKFSKVCYNNILFYKSLLFSTSYEIKQLALSDSLATEKLNLLKSYKHRLSVEYAKTIATRQNVSDLEEKANDLEKDLTRSVAEKGEVIRLVQSEELNQTMKLSSAAIEFISYHYFTPKPTDSVLYAALVLLPSDTTPHFIPLFEERQLQALLNRPGLSEKLILKDLYGNNPELRRLIWGPLEPLLADVKTIYYSPSGLLHRINPGAILDESNQPLSEGRDWVRLGSTRELVTGRLADRSFARSPEENSNSTLTAMVYGGITYDMDSLAFARANPVGAVDSTEMPLRKDGAFSYIISEQPDGSGTRGNPDGTWSTLAATSKEADEVSAMLAGAGFSTQKRQGFYASEEQFKQVGVNAPSPRVLHLATHGFSYPDPKKTPPKGFADSEPTYKMLDDPMLRSGLVLAGANYYWKNKRPLTNREDGVLVAYEVRDLNLRNTELAVLSACQTGLGDVVGSEGVYGLQRAFRIAGAKFLIVSLWQVPDEQTQELMRLFYQNWLDKKESLRDAFNHAQQALREKEPSPFMWAGFVLVE